MKIITTGNWIKISIINLLLVSLIGVLMRYKIGFEFPHFTQKNLLNAHSHFAFYGWVTQTLMVLIIHFLIPDLKDSRLKTYNFILAVNLLCSYSMLVSFTLTGYATLSIILSTLSIFISYIFTILCFNDFKNRKEKFQEIMWFKAALVFNFISTLGTFYLAFMMTTKAVEQHSFLGSLYWFLHFQYNGWFFFACTGLFITTIKKLNPKFKLSQTVFWLFTLSCVPAFGLSILWLKLPLWIYIIIISGAIAQLLGWIKLLIEVRAFKSDIKINSHLNNILYIIIGLCISTKLILQLFSVIPSISQLAFGFRPIVIAYLHLILLAIISVFIINHLSVNQLISNTKLTTAGIIIFILGVYLNEIILCIQGIASFSYNIIPFANESLFVVALIIFSGITVLLISQLRKA